MLLLLLLLCCPSAVYLFGVFFCCFSTPLHSSSIRSKVLSFLFRSTFLIFFISLAAYSVALRAYSHVDTNQERESAQSLLHMYTLKTIPYTLYYNRMIFRQLFFFHFTFGIFISGSRILLLLVRIHCLRCCHRLLFVVLLFKLYLKREELNKTIN